MLAFCKYLLFILMSIVMYMSVCLSVCLSYKQIALIRC